MSDLLSVGMQDVMHGGQSEVREPQVKISKGAEGLLLFFCFDFFKRMI